MWHWEYIYTSARRAPSWDRYAAGERVIETNDDLPKDAEPFYIDED
jgi:hypothetical protein